MENLDNLIQESIEKSYQEFKNGNYFYVQELCRQILRIKEQQEAIELLSLSLCKTDDKECFEWMDKLEKNYKTYNNTALMYSHFGEKDKAIEYFNKAINCNPKKSYLYVNLAVEEGSCAALDEAMKICPDEHVYFNYGAIIQQENRLEEAISYYHKALEIKPDSSICHYNLSACYFLLDDYEKGWEEYEWRWKQFDRFANIRNRFKEPFWNGENLKNKTIVLYMEQGIGDLIMFYRFIKQLEGNIILECPKTLHSLLDCQVCEQYEGPLDYHCSLASLPRILKTIDPSPYLHSKGLGKTDWGNGFKIGICWAGSPIHPNDKNRSCKLSLFENLPGKLYSFQKDTRPHCYGRETIDYIDKPIEMVDLSPYMNDFNCTAKMLEEMDLIVTVDTSLAHLAGALGIKTFIVLPLRPDWRWGIKSNTTKWYDCVTLFRQETKGDWKSVFDKVRQHLFN